MEDKPKYDNYNICPVCNGYNKIDRVDGVEHTICEAKTTCNKCGHEDYWSYGFHNREI
jgi:hypothetical protein